MPNPNAKVAAPVSTGGRHRKPDPEDEADVPVAEFSEYAERSEFPEFPEFPEATTEVVPAQRVASLTVPPPVA